MPPAPMIPILMSTTPHRCLRTARGRTGPDEGKTRTDGTQRPAAAGPGAVTVHECLRTRRGYAAVHGLPAARRRDRGVGEPGRRRAACGAGAHRTAPAGAAAAPALEVVSKRHRARAESALQAFSKPLLAVAHTQNTNANCTPR